MLAATHVAAILLITFHSADPVMSQHEYVFIAVSIILGLAITRMLHTVAILIRVHDRVIFHWATALWALCVMAFVLQFWWVGWGLRDVVDWRFTDFLVLIVGAIFVYGAAEMALPVPDDDGDDDELDFLHHSEGFGRLSVLSMLIYLCMGPYVNLAVAIEPPPVMLALLLPAIGVGMLLAMAIFPRIFRWLCPLFAGYALLIIFLTA
jgi:hypothetical protein